MRIRQGDAFRVGAKKVTILFPEHWHGRAHLVQQIGEARATVLPITAGHAFDVTPGVQIWFVLTDTSIITAHDRIALVSDMQRDLLFLRPGREDRALLLFELFWRGSEARIRSVFRGFPGGADVLFSHLGVLVFDRPPSRAAPIARA